MHGQKNITYYPDICLHGLRKTIPNLHQDHWCPGWESN